MGAYKMQPDVIFPVRGSVSSSVFPEETRLNSWRDLFGQQILRIDVDPLDDDPFLYDMEYLALPGATLSRGMVTAVRCTRTRDLIQDDNDDLVLVFPGSGRMQLRERGKEIEFTRGDAMIRRSSEVGETLTSPGGWMAVSLSRAAMAACVPGIERLGFAVIPRDNPALRLLRGFLRMLLDGAADGSVVDTGATGAGVIKPGTTRAGAMGSDRTAPEMAARHVQEMAGLMLDSGRDTWQRLDGPDSGLRAARVAAIRADIERHVTDPDFSIADLARRQGISPVYVRKLLAAEGARFSDIVRETRLDLAHRLLRDARYSDMLITDIAYHCGFGDVSYFNRCFRRRFDAAPGDIRRSGEDR